MPLSITALGMVLALSRGPQLPGPLLALPSVPPPPHTHIRPTVDITLIRRAIEGERGHLAIRCSRTGARHADLASVWFVSRVAGFSV
ncbi:hypothetical protein [Mesorhizobium sp.]|uniref:hypothetical protein n=1 Tax=Mesorhizobium sp. TaxID=1871066 RepID=UPI00257D7108|nr:hypothetical protein [Mesorhizobium sp.]